MYPYTTLLSGDTVESIRIVMLPIPGALPRSGPTVRAPV